jgi:aspartokinase-like uncharacterized kinase
VLLASPRPLLVVPGGGIFADTVRNSPADDDSAHWMAIAAMEQYGLLIASRGIPATGVLESPDRPVVFLPYCCMRTFDPLPHSWDVTSDSIAAWIADSLRAELLVLKSADGISSGGNVADHILTPVATDVVDPFFLPFVLEKNIPVTIINGSRPDLLEQFLRGDPVPGTRIGTTF